MSFLVFLKHVFPCCLLFCDRIFRELARGKKGEKRKVCKKGRPYFLLEVSAGIFDQNPYLVARIHGSHLGGSGSISGMGT
jgi:hypothetical protein